MRISHVIAGTALLGALVLTGCSSNEAKPAEETKPAATSEAPAATTDAPEAGGNEDCAPLNEGDKIDAAALTSCISDAMKDTAGFAATSDTAGMETTVQVDTATNAMAMEIMGSTIIKIGDKGWVNPGTGWAEADPNSSDPMVKGLSASIATMDVSTMWSSAGTAAASQTGELVAAKGENVLGQDTIKLTGTITAAGVEAETTYYVTSDYVLLKSEQKVTASGQTVDINYEVTEWDKAQDIKAPM